MINSKYLCEILEIIFIGMLIPYLMFVKLMKSLQIDFLFREIIDIIFIGVWFPYLIIIELKKKLRIVYFAIYKIYDRHIFIMQLRIYMYPGGVVDKLLFHLLLVGIIVYIILWLVRLLFILNHVLPLSDIWNDLREAWVAMFPISWSKGPFGPPSHGNGNMPNPKPQNPNDIMPVGRKKEAFSDEWEPIGNAHCRFPLKERHGFMEEVCLSLRDPDHLGDNGNYLVPLCHLASYKEVRSGVIQAYRANPDGSVFRDLPNVNPHGLASLIAEINCTKKYGEHGYLELITANDGLTDLYRVDINGNRKLVTNESAKHEFLWAYRNCTHPKAWPEVNRFGELLK